MKHILLNTDISNAELSFSNTKNLKNLINFKNLKEGSAIRVISIQHDLFNIIITKITPKRIYAKVLLND